MSPIPFALRACLIGALVVLALAAGFVALQERATSLALQSGDLSGLSAAPTGLRIALALLVLVIAALGYLIFVVVRRADGGATAPRADEGAESATPAPADQLQETADSGPLLSTEAGSMIAIGGLVRRFSHELANTLNPVQGYADLLIEDQRLSDLHRRHVGRIAQATATALRDLQSIGAALNWSTLRATPAQLDKTVAAAVAVAQSAIGARVRVAIMPGGDVLLTASEAEIGQAILHACASVGALLAERDVQIDIKVDALVGQTAPGMGDRPGAGRHLEIWSDPFEPARTKVQYGALQPSWRYGRVRFECNGHGWAPEPAGRLFTAELPDDDVGGLFMTILGRLILNLGGAVMVDTQPLHHAHITMFWPARITSQIAAPLEIEAPEEDLDALIIDADEAASEALSRRLTGFGLRVASTTSAETAIELLGEMGPRCRAILIGRSVDAALADQVRQAARDCEVMPLGPTADAASWPIDPDQETLERLAARLRAGADAPGVN